MQMQIFPFTLLLIWGLN
uniref:Uncharacterized protein n=1 Tax=Arundo donax TaxID=35708 RepID=A0A0A9AJQ5_ARUDO